MREPKPYFMFFIMSTQDVLFTWSSFSMRKKKFQSFLHGMVIVSLFCLFLRMPFSTHWYMTLSRRLCWLIKGRSESGTSSKPTSPTSLKKVHNPYMVGSLTQFPKERFTVKENVVIFPTGESSPCCVLRFVFL